MFHFIRDMRRQAQYERDRARFLDRRISEIQAELDTLAPEPPRPYLNQLIDDIRRSRQDIRNFQPLS